MYQLRILPGAKNDIKEAANWYNEKLLGLGKRFRDNVRKKANTIRNNPGACSLRYANMRTTVLDVFPYMIHYFVDEPNMTVVISAVLHTGRNPDSWKR